jgi:hypothetical protein
MDRNFSDILYTSYISNDTVIDTLSVKFGGDKIQNRNRYCCVTLKKPFLNSKKHT